MKKPDNENIKITTPKSTKPYIIDADSPVYSRDLIIIRKKKKPFFQNMNKKAPATGSATLRIHFLATGQIDKVDVISSSNFEYTQNIIDTLKDWRFVPAQIDGKDVDCTKIFEFDSFTI
jgi:TonB family protein